MLERERKRIRRDIQKTRRSLRKLERRESRVMDFACDPIIQMDIRALREKLIELGELAKGE